MSKKTLLRKDESGELARLLTLERLKAAGVTTTGTRSKNVEQDPNLRALFECARSTETTPAKSKRPKLNRQMVKKLAGVG